MILSAMLLTFFIAAEAAPVQAAGRAELVMDGKAVSPGTVVALPKGATVAFSLKLDGTYGMGYTSGNGAVAQTGSVQRFSDGEAVYAVKAIGQLGDSAGLYIDGEKILEMKITEGAVCPACGEVDCAFVQIVTGEWRADGAERALRALCLRTGRPRKPERCACLYLHAMWDILPSANRDCTPVDLPWFTWVM